MDNPKIRIESDGITAKVYLDGKEIRCTALDFHGDVDGGTNIRWSGTMQKLDENDRPIIKNSEVATEEFHYDSKETVLN